MARGATARRAPRAGWTACRGLAAVAETAGASLDLVTDPTDPALVDVDVVLVAAGVEALGPWPPGAPPRWIIGDAKDAGRLAGAAVACGAIGVLLFPVAAGAIAAIAATETTTVEGDVARARSLVAGSAIPTSDDDGLPAFAKAFAADDSIVWWRDGDAMTPHGAREAPDDSYRPSVAAIEPSGSRSRICSTNDSDCSTSRTRIHTRALTSPSFRTGTSKRSPS